MSYQIKATPLLRHRRVVAKKKRELERLKEEYARIKELNDRTIELKMRQVRLNRLFREIEEIKEQTALRVRRQQLHPVIKPKTEEELRIETIKRSKSLGTEFSKVNRFLIHAYQQGKMRKKKEVSSTEKRIRYGNDISRWNFKANLKQKRREKAVLKAYHDLTDPSFTDLPKSEKLRCRLFYGNTQSYINMLKTLKEKRNKFSPRHSLLSELINGPIAEVDEPTATTITTTTTTTPIQTEQKTDDTVIEEIIPIEEKTTVVNESYIKLALFALACKNFESSQQDSEVGENVLCNVPSSTLVSTYDVKKSEKHGSSESFADVASDENLMAMNVYEQESDSTDQPETVKPQKQLTQLAEKTDTQQQQQELLKEIKQFEEQQQQLLEEEIEQQQRLLEEEMEQHQQLHEEDFQQDEEQEFKLLQEIQLEQQDQEDEDESQEPEEKVKKITPLAPLALKITDAMYWPPRLSATTSSFILNTSFSKLDGKRGPPPPVPKKPNSAAINKEAMQLASLYAPHIRNVVKEHILSTKELRAIFEHEN